MNTAPWPARGQLTDFAPPPRVFGEDWPGSSRQDGSGNYYVLTADGTVGFVETMSDPAVTVLPANSPSNAAPTALLRRDCRVGPTAREIELVERIHESA